MKKLLIFLLIIPGLVYAAFNQSADSPIFGSIESQNQNQSQGQFQSAPTFSSLNNNNNLSNNTSNTNSNNEAHNNSYQNSAQSNPVANSLPSRASPMGTVNTPDDNDNENNIQMRSSTHMGDVLNLKLPVFGYNLFGSQCAKLHQARFFNPEYRLAVGDVVSIQIWGAFRMTEKLTVDTQGNIFLPEVGPIKVEGIENQKLNQIVQRHVKETFKKGVKVYADLVTAQPVQVYVTGYVNAPGLYDGLSSDSVIYFLCAADGINLQEGSFRDIDIVRSGKEIQNIDLYDFLLKGAVSPFQLHQGDTIVVKQQKYIVSVAGDVKNSYQYELLSHETPLTNLMKLANVEQTATYVRIQRNQGMKPTFIYQQINQSKPISIQAGDRVTFVADKEIQQTLITVRGQIKGPHQYVIKHGTSLADFTKRLELSPQANLDNLQLFRENVARQQKDALNTSLSRLQRQAMTAEPLTGDDAKAQEARSQLITKFVYEARQVETRGQVVVGHPSQWDKIQLENNDVINIPQMTSVVTVSGDVVNSISLSVNPNYRLIDYIKAAGGFQKTANQNEFLLMRQNGQVEVIKNSWNSRRVTMEGGDQLVVLPKETENGIKVTGMMSSILYQLAIAAKVAMAI